MGVAEHVEYTRLQSPGAAARRWLRRQPDFIQQVEDLPQSLVPQSLHDGGEQHLRSEVTPRHHDNGQNYTTTTSYSLGHQLHRHTKASLFV